MMYGQFFIACRAVSDWISTDSNYIVYNYILVSLTQVYNIYVLYM